MVCCSRFSFNYSVNAGLNDYDKTYYNDGKVRYYLANSFSVGFGFAFHAKVCGEQFKSYSFQIPPVTHSIVSSYVKSPLPENHNQGISGFTQHVEFSENGEISKFEEGSLNKYLTLGNLKYYYNDGGVWHVDREFHLSAGYFSLPPFSSVRDDVLQQIKLNFPHYSFYSKKIERLLDA